MQTKQTGANKANGCKQNKRVQTKLTGANKTNGCKQNKRVLTKLTGNFGTQSRELVLLALTKFHLTKVKWQNKHS